MLQEVKKIFLAGVGAAVMTYDKALEIIEQLVARGKLTVELKKDINEKAELAKNKASNKIQDLKSVTKDDVNEILKSFDFATKSEIDDIKVRITKLEEELKNK